MDYNEFVLIRIEFGRSEDCERLFLWTKIYEGSVTVDHTFLNEVTSKSYLGMRRFHRERESRSPILKTIFAKKKSEQRPKFAWES